MNVGDAVGRVVSAHLDPSPANPRRIVDASIDEFVTGAETEIQGDRIVIGRQITYRVALYIYCLFVRFVYKLMYPEFGAC